MLLKKSPRIICWLVLLALTVGMVETWASDKEDIVEYIKDYLRIYKARREVSIALVPYLVETSRAYGLDPWLVAVTISMESSWMQDAKGEKGEKGMTQVHGFCARGENLNTGKGQILAGVKCLAHAAKKCPDTLTIINAYRFGKCYPILPKSRLRFRRYKKAKRDFSHHD